VSVKHNRQHAALITRSAKIIVNTYSLWHSYAAIAYTYVLQYTLISAKY